MSEQETYNLDRQIAIENNVDALGKKWEITKAGRESNLLIAIPNPYREDFVCPKPFAGKWTSNDLIQEAITLYLNQSWDQAEAIAQKNLRKKIAAEEAAVFAAIEKAAAEKAAAEEAETLEKSQAAAAKVLEAKKPVSKSQVKRVALQKGK